MKRHISILLTGIIALQPLTTLSAEPNSSDVLLTSTPQTFSAIVPTELPVYMDKLGVITTAEDTVITNTSKGPIIVHDISVEIKDSSWSMAHFTSDFTKFKVNSNILGLQFNGDNVTSSGTTELNPAHWPSINGLESMALNYNAKLAAQSGLLTDVRPVKVVFTLKWNEAGKADIVDSGSQLTVGDNKLFSLNFTNVIAEDDSIVWSSSNESVATVKDHVSKGRAMISGSKDCEVTAIGIGTAIITGTLKDGTSASMDIVVTEKVVDIAVGTKYVEGNYEYSYGESLNLSGKWTTISGQKGWGIKVVDNTQTDYESPLTTIQGRPVTNMSALFYVSPAPTLNLIDWNTSNVTIMSDMFRNSSPTNINGLNNFDTSKITNMNWMFGESKATSLDLSSFDTSNVTDMELMFSSSQATNIVGLSSFNTSKVTDMSQMFNNTQATILDVSSFDTSNVIEMSGMFSTSQATSLDLSSFNTSKVINMRAMFSESQVTSLDVSNFDTSNVKIMSAMFQSNYATNLDLGNFDTSNVIEMASMFAGSKATSINGLNTFDTSKVTDMNKMFHNTQETMLDLINFDTSNVTNMQSMFESSLVTNLDLSNFDTSKVTDMKEMFRSSQVKNLTARTQADADNYKSSRYFPENVTIIVKA